MSLAAHVEDLEAVVDAAELDRFALLGISQGGALAVSYAVRHPERVSHLLLCGAYARGRVMRRSLTAPQREQEELLRSVMEVGWGRPDRDLSAGVHDDVRSRGTPQSRWSGSTSSSGFRRPRKPRFACAGPGVRSTSPSCLASSQRSDAGCPRARRARRAVCRRPTTRHRRSTTPASSPLEGRNHILLADEPAWPAFLAEARSFLGTGIEPAAPTLDDLSPREVEVLGLVADGLSNEEIGAPALPQRPYRRAPSVERLREAPDLRQGGPRRRRSALCHPRAARALCVHTATRICPDWVVSPMSESASEPRLIAIRFCHLRRNR